MKNESKQALRDLIAMLKQELQWCKDNDKKADLPRQFKRGFKDGVRQSIGIARELKRQMD